MNVLAGLNAGMLCSGIIKVVFFEILRAVFCARFFTMKLPKPRRYTFSPDEIDFDFYYESYKKYIEGFKKQNIDFVKSEEGRKWLETISTKKYYINLHAVLNIFWLLYCAIYLNFAEEFKENVSFSYFQHGIDRIVYFERALSRIQNEN